MKMKVGYTDVRGLWNEKEEGVILQSKAVSTDSEWPT